MGQSTWCICRLCGTDSRKKIEPSRLHRQPADSLSTTGWMLEAANPEHDDANVTVREQGAEQNDANMTQKAANTEHDDASANVRKQGAHHVVISGGSS